MLLYKNNRIFLLILSLPYSITNKADMQLTPYQDAPYTSKPMIVAGLFGIDAGLDPLFVSCWIDLYPIIDLEVVSL